jgi:hypothetical protein
MMSMRDKDQFARPRRLTPITRRGTTTMALIAGSVWPPPAGSVTPPLDTLWPQMPSIK